jgi:hypothetical protein
MARYINAAERLTNELGGTEEKVKRWLFSARGQVLDEILDAYAIQYGHPARAYAAGAIPKWESGRVKMSGRVAERLFSLLPPYMPPILKYEIVEGLWRHYGPSSKTTIWASPEVSLDELMANVQERVDKLITSYAIPPCLEARFAWLASGDVGIKQQLLNHLRTTDKAMAVASARAKIPVLIEHLKTDDAGLTQHVSQNLSVGKHLLEIVIDWHAVGIQETQPLPPDKPEPPSPVIFRMVIALAVVGLLVCAGMPAL